LASWLLGVHLGEFITGSIDEVKQKVETEQAQNDNYGDPTQTLPEAPPPMCINPKTCSNCSNCKDLECWWTTLRVLNEVKTSSSNPELMKNSPHGQ
jgi:hypothetical protein